MQLTFTPPSSTNKKCLLLVGGTGDSAKRFQPIADLLKEGLPDYNICTFTLSQSSQGDISLLNLQTQELAEVMQELVTMDKFSSYALFATSMGAYPATSLLLNPKYQSKIGRVVYFDPADYYISDNFSDPEAEISWAGYQEYSPRKPVISDKLLKYRGDAIIDVVHLTVRNHSANGYLESDYSKRGEDNPKGFSRLSTPMVKKFYSNCPSKNRGKYIEVNHLPHGYIRDGNIPQNIAVLTQIVISLLK